MKSRERNRVSAAVLKTSLVSAILAILMLIAVYVYWNIQPTFGFGDGLITKISIAKELMIEHEYVEDVVAVDVSYDRTAVPYSKANDEYLGMVDLTDRGKLNSFLKMLKERDAYRYIVCDINFSDSLLRTEYDEELFATIASMRDIVVASSDIGADPVAIRNKVALSEYGYLNVGDDFLKYDYLMDGNQSMALRMWLDMTQGTYEEFWWGARINGKPCLKTIIPDFKFAIYNDVDSKDNHINIQNLNKTLTFYQTNPRYVRGFDDKVILLGAWKNDDIHDTIIGQQPGIVVVYNAFLALCNGDNIVPFWIYLLLFAAFWIEVMIVLRRFYVPQVWERIKEHDRNKSHKSRFSIVRLKDKITVFLENHTVIRYIYEIAVDFVDYVVVLGLLMIIVYRCCGIFVNVIIVGLMLGIINYVQGKVKLN